MQDIIDLQTDNEGDFIIGYVISRPTKNLFFGPNYLTFAFIVFKDYPRTVFMFWSDHKDGVYLHLAKNGFDCSEEFVVYSEEKCPNIIIHDCLPFGSQKYAFIDWETGNTSGGGSLEDFSNLRIGYKLTSL